MKHKSIKPTGAELNILRVLWDQGTQTVRQVHSILNPNNESGYTTTLKIMQIMTEKGLLERDSSQRSHIYSAILREEDTQKKLLDTLVDTAFGGSAMKLVVQALGSNSASKDEISQIRNMLDQMEKEKS
ncbi:BlaI/MecI/CopY family transcriptional regulator [bacterium]|nr:BlaI/MecI/CopY family transcriptional regulator [bacterium]